MIAPTEETEHNKERKNAMQNEELEIIRMSEIQMREVEWLWYPYIPFGKLTIIQGDPGEGKTTFALRLAAACSTGTAMPGMESLSPFNVIYQSAEDGLEDTIKPRLTEAGADQERVINIREDKKSLHLLDSRIEKAIVRCDAKLLILDPLQGYLGERIDMNRANEIREVMKAIGQVAQRTGCAIVLVGHLNKATGMISAYRGLGSIDFRAAARRVLVVGRLRKNNSVSCENGYKYHSDNENIERLRAESDKLCPQYGLSVLPPKEQSQKVKQMSSREYRAAERGESWKMQLIVTIEDAMAIARSREHFIRLMEAEGYEVKWTRDRKSITYTTPDGKRCRNNKLHEEKFLKENMEYEFRIRNEIARGIKGYGESAYEESGNRRPLYSSDGRELEGSDRRDEYADRYALSDTEIADRAGNQRGTHLVYGTADRDTDRVRRELPGTDRTVHRNDGTDGNSIYREDEYGNREYVITGWESERTVFTESIFGTGNGENVYETEYMDLADPDGGADHLGTDTAYLFADLTNIIDEDAPVEDCTTMRQPQHRKKNNGPVMGGM